MSRYVESRATPLSSVEQDFQNNLVSINLSPAGPQIIKIHNNSILRYCQGSPGQTSLTTAPRIRWNHPDNNTMILTKSSC